MTDTASRLGEFRQRAAAELRQFSIIALYLAVLLGSFTLYRRLTYAELIIVFSILGHAVGALVHGEPWARAIMNFSGKGIDEMLARTLVLVVALIPFFAFMELSRALGPGKVAALFFSRPARLP
jgi:hypothetical protein